MHIPDGYLSPQTYVPLYGATFVFWAVALRKLKKELSTKRRTSIDSLTAEQEEQARKTLLVFEGIKEFSSILYSFKP